MALSPSDRIKKMAWKLRRWLRRGQTVRRHPAVWEKELGDSGLHATCVSPTVSVPIMDRNDGYHWYGNDWWTNLRCPRA